MLDRERDLRNRLCVRSKTKPLAFRKLFHQQDAVSFSLGDFISASWLWFLSRSAVFRLLKRFGAGVKFS